MPEGRARHSVRAVPETIPHSALPRRNQVKAGDSELRIGCPPIVLVLVLVVVLGPTVGLPARTLKPHTPPHPPIPNPKGIASSSPGLRVTRNPG